MSLRERLAGSVVRHEDVEIPDTGITVRIVRLGGESWTEWQQAVADHDKKPHSEYLAGLIACCARDPETGEKAFTADDVPMLLAKVPIPTLADLGRVCLVLNGPAAKN